MKKLLRMLSMLLTAAMLLSTAAMAAEPLEYEDPADGSLTAGLLDGEAPAVELLEDENPDESASGDFLAIGWLEWRYHEAWGARVFF